MRRSLAPEDRLEAHEGKRSWNFCCTDSEDILELSSSNGRHPHSSTNTICEGGGKYVKELDQEKIG